MPLKSKPSPPHISDDAGVTWTMFDLYNGKPVEVFASAEALRALAPGGASFASDAGMLMRIASLKYDRGGVEADGAVRITPADAKR